MVGFTSLRRLVRCALQYLRRPHDDSAPRHVANMGFFYVFVQFSLVSLNSTRRERITLPRRRCIQQNQSKTRFLDVDVDGLGSYVHKWIHDI